MPNSKPIWLFTLLVAACAESSTTPPSVVDHGDGTYSLAPPEDVDVTTTRREGALTWRYAGQARHSRNPKPITEHTYVAAARTQTTDEQRILGTIREDDDGSRWIVSAVDMPKVRDMVAARDAASGEVARGLTVDDPNRKVTAEEPVGRRMTIKPNSWVFDDCDNSGGLFATDDDNHYWETTDNRIAVGADSSRRKAMVQIGRVIPGVNCPYNGDYVACLADPDPEISVDWCKSHVLNCQNQESHTSAVCTGTILRQNFVVTAAHCVYDDNNLSIANSSIKVKRVDGVDDGWLPVSSKFIDAGFNPEWDPSDDWVLLKLTAPLTAPFFDMDISGASDTTLSNLSQVSNLAFPAFAPNCTSNGSVGMFLANGDLGAIYSARVNFQLDGGPRHSGSPIFFCPGGNNNDTCEDDEKGFIVSVWTGWNGFETTMVGAKGPEQRTGAIAIMDSNPP